MDKTYFLELFGFAIIFGLLVIMIGFPVYTDVSWQLEHEQEVCNQGWNLTRLPFKDEYTCWLSCNKKSYYFEPGTMFKESVCRCWE